MLRLSLAAWHWTQRPDCTSTNLSIGYWQTARILPCWVRQRMHGATPRCASKSAQQPGVKPVFLAYAYEALARAEAAAGEEGIAYGYLTEARRLAEQVEEADDRAAPAGRPETVR